MLILSRRKGQRIHVGENITVEIIEIRGGKTRIGITAPGDVKILREEIIDQADQGGTVPVEQKA